MFLSFSVLDYFFRFYFFFGFWVFLVHPTVVSVLLSASVERFFVCRMRDLFIAHIQGHHELCLIWRYLRLGLGKILLLHCWPLVGPETRYCACGRCLCCEWDMWIPAFFFTLFTYALLKFSASFWIFMMFFLCSITSNLLANIVSHTKHFSPLLASTLSL